MTKIFACINTYGSPESLKRTLESLRGHVDGAVIHEGPYAGWPRLGGDSPSSPGECATGLPFPTMYTRHGHLLQKTARTQALQLAATLKPTSDDWLLIIDDDEVLDSEAVLRVVLSSWAADYASIDVEDLRFGRKFPQNRLVRWTPGLHYEPNHWTIRSPLGVITQNASPPFYQVHGVSIVNDPSLRSKAWLHRRSLYRMLQFIGNEGTWSTSKYFEGSDCEAVFVDPEALAADLESIKRSAASGNEFDMGLLLMLAQIASGSEQEIVQWSDRTKGMVTGLLYAAGVIPWPYAKKSVKDEKEASVSP
jgi:hypothetical protein